MAWPASPGRPDGPDVCLSIRACRGRAPQRADRHRTGRPAIFCRQLFPEGWKDRWDKTVTTPPSSATGWRRLGPSRNGPGCRGANGRQKGYLDGMARAPPPLMATSTGQQPRESTYLLVCLRRVGPRWMNQRGIRILDIVFGFFDSALLVDSSYRDSDISS